MISQQIILPRGRADSGKAIRFLQALPLDKPFRVEVSDYKPRRSDQQNRYLFGVVYPYILEAGGEDLGGWTKHELHDYFLGEHFGWETVTGFGRTKMRPIRRSSKLNKQEFSDYIAFIQQRMAEHCIVIPDPEFPA